MTEKVVVWNVDGTYKIASSDSTFDIVATCGEGAERMWYTIKGKVLEKMDYTFKTIAKTDLSSVAFNDMQLFDTGNEILCILKDENNITIYRGDLKILPQEISVVDFAVKVVQRKVYFITRTTNDKLVFYML